jgi:hypothetical protein
MDPELRDGKMMDEGIAGDGRRQAEEGLDDEDPATADIIAQQRNRAAAGLGYSSRLKFEFCRVSSTMVPPKVRRPGPS